MAKRTRLTPAQLAKKHGYKSGLEDGVSEQLKALGIPICYEEVKIPFMQPTKKRSYRPDFLLPNGIFIETKGRFLLADRQKHVWIKEQYPKLDIRFVFTNSKALLRKGAKMTLADWCVKEGFLYADKTIPQTWLEEKGND